MKKLDQIKLEVSNVIVKLRDISHELKNGKTFDQLNWHYNVGNILTSLAKKCAEINVEDWDSCTRTWIYDTIQDYNSRLRDGQVEETHEQKQEEKHALQPLPEKAPEWFMHTSSKGMRTSIWNQLRYHFGTQPPEWWMDLKKGDKFMYYNGVDGEVRTFRGIIYLAAKEPEICDLSKCSPYTDPTQSFRSKLTPEMQVEFDKVIETINNK